MTAEDRLDILDQIGRYSYAADDRDAEGMAARFTADGVFERREIGSDGPVFRAAGRAALLGWATEVIASRGDGVLTRHHQRATVFDELEAETARTRTMLLLTRFAPGDRHPRTVLSGVYRDEWRRTDEGWRIARRVADLDRPASDASRG